MGQASLVTERKPPRAPQGTAPPQPRAGGPRLGQRPWLGLLAAAVIVAAAVAVGVSPLWGGATGIFLLLVLLPLRAPAETALLILVTAWIPIEDLAGAEREILASLGGLNLSGVRLIGALVGLALGVVICRERVRRVELPAWAKTLLVLYGVTVGWMALTILWTPHPIDGLRSASKLVFPVLVAAVLVADPRGWGPHGLAVRLLWALGTATTVAAVFGFWDGLPTEEVGSIPDVWHWPGHAQYAFYVAIPCLFALALGEHRIVSRLWMALGAATAVQVTLVLNRIAVGALGVATSFMHAGGGARRIVAPVGVIIAAALLLAFPPLVSRNLYLPSESTPSEARDPSVSTVPGARDPPVGEATSRSTEAVSGIARSVGDLARYIRLEGRDYLWSGAINEMSGGDFIYGKGLNAFWDPSVQEVAERTGRSLLHANQLHGEYIRLLYETGAIGLLLMLTAYGAALFRLLKVAGRADRGTIQRATAQAGLGAIVFYLLTAVTDNTFDYYLVGGTVWAVLAVAATATGSPREERDRQG